MSVITSRQNPLLKQVRKLLRSASYREEQQVFVVEGPHAVAMVMDAPAWAARVQHVLVSSSFAESGNAERYGADRTVAADDVFDSVSDVRRAQGILAIVRKPTPSDIAPADEGPVSLLLDGISDPGNLGTLIRSAAAAGLRRILLHGPAVDPFNPKVLRATAGMFTRVDCMPASVTDIQSLLDAGARLVRAQAGATLSLYDYVPNGDILLAVGHEAHGFSSGVAGLPGENVSIPMAPGCESLNAAVAGSICLFEIVRKV